MTSVVIENVLQLEYSEPFASVRGAVIGAVEQLHGLANLEFVESELYRVRPQWQHWDPFVYGAL